MSIIKLTRFAAMCVACAIVVTNINPSFAQSTDRGPDTCKQGFVWREATSADRVCVAPKIRTEAAEDNKQAGARRIGL
jgi:hypothetical protein